jgi:integrase
MTKVATKTVLAGMEALLGASGLEAKELEKAAKKIEAAARKIIAGIKAATSGSARKAIVNTSQVMSAAPGVYRISNAVGLYLKKSGDDTGSYFFRYRFGEKRREMGLGPISGPTAITLAKARDKAGELARLRKTADPIEARKRAKKAAADKAEADAAAAKKQVTFEAAARAYLETNAPKWKHKYARAGWWNPLEKYALPVIGAKALDSIVVEDVAAAMSAAVRAGAPVAARKVRASIEQVIDAGIALGQRDARSGNPARLKLVEKVAGLNKHKTQHYRRINLDDAPAAFRRLKELAATPVPAAPRGGVKPMDDVAGCAWVFMIATAARPSEALKAKWSEIDLNKKLWTLPAERMKSDKEHAAPLSSAALWALELMQAKRTGDAVFPGRGGAPLASSSFSDAVKKAGIDAGAPHSWRSIFRDWAGDIDDAPRELAESALAHTLGAVEGGYRRGTAIKKRIPLMDRYANWLENDAPARVVAFPGQAA